MIEALLWWLDWMFRVLFYAGMVWVLLDHAFNDRRPRP